MKHLLAALLLCLTVGAGAAPLPATGTVEVLFTPWDDAEGAIVRALGEARAKASMSRPSCSPAVRSPGRCRRPRRAASRWRCWPIARCWKRATSRCCPACGPAASRSGWKRATPRPQQGAADRCRRRPDAVVITGSYNFTWSAQARNAENLLILRGNPALVRRYLDNWRRHRDEAEKMTEPLNDGKRPAPGSGSEVLPTCAKPDLVWQLLALAPACCWPSSASACCVGRRPATGAPGNSATAA
jgi:hypothetical protein